MKSFDEIFTSSKDFASTLNLELEIFKIYFNNIILNSKYLFYATHKLQPSESLIRAKIQMIEKRFEAVKKLPSRDRKILNILYKRKI